MRTATAAGAIAARPTLAACASDLRMAEAHLSVLLTEAEIAARIEALADNFAAQVDDGWTVVALMQGALPFAADLMRAIERRGRHPIYDLLWLESYRDARESSGKVVVRADISRPIEGRPALILDDVFDSGRTIAFARNHLLAKGATQGARLRFRAQAAGAERADRRRRLGRAGQFPRRLRHGR